MKEKNKDPQDKPNTNKNLSIRADISVKTLNVNDSMLQPKDLHCLNEDKNKTSIYAVCKRPMSELGTHRLKVRVSRKISQGNQN